jgi:pseudouridylate synthase
MLAANRTVPGEPWVALETTLLAHGVPRGGGLPLARELAEVVSRRGARAAVVGVLGGEAIVGMGERELATLLADGDVPKVNTANLGIVLHRGQHGATAVSATIELAAAAGVRVFATGGLGAYTAAMARTSTSAPTWRRWRGSRSPWWRAA